MLVETCSSIGQELSKTTKPTDIAAQFDGRKKSSPNSSKPNSPNSRPSPTLQAAHRAALKQNNIYGSAAGVLPQSQITNLTAQYQLMYQQLLYQAELEYQRANSKPVGTAAAPLKHLCTVCSLTPGYNGHCVHNKSDSTAAAAALNPAMLAMLNPTAALAYSKLMGFGSDSSLSSPSHNHQQGLLRSSSLSPPAAHDSRRSSSSSNTGQLTREQPIDLHVPPQRSPSPLPQKECHWVGAEGYCGKRFHSQDDLMSHLKYHVITCPNVSTESRSRSPLKSYKDSNFNSSSMMQKPRHRINPYNLPEKHLTAAMLRH